MSVFRKAMLWTAIPLVLLGIISTVGTTLIGTSENASFYGFLILSFIGFAIAGCVLIVALILLFSSRTRQAAAGMLVGIGIAIVALGLTCFAATRIP